jgi:hypothetical protein
VIRIGVLVAVAACTTGTPTPTGARCPDPDPMTLTYDNFGKPFMTTYCTMCHSSRLNRPSLRNGAPTYHDFDTLFGVIRVDNGPTDHIDEQAGWGPDAHNDFMPGARCPSVPGGKLDSDCKQPTAEERTNLAIWLACERDRPHDFTDAGIDAP